MKRLASGSVLLVIATLLGVMTAAAAFGYLSRTTVDQADVATATERTRPVVVSLVEVDAGTRLTSDMVEVREVPDVAILLGSAADPLEVVGRVTRYPLITGEQVTSNKLVLDGQSSGSGLAFSVPPGMRAAAVPVNEIRGSGGLIVPGDRVDVVVHTDYERLFAPSGLTTLVESDERRQPTTLTVLQDVLVLAVAQSTTPPIDGQSDASTLRPDGAEAQPAAGSVTLAVTPSQAQSLFFATQEGTVGLMLRPFGETETSRLDPLLKLEPLGPASNSLVSN